MSENFKFSSFFILVLHILNLATCCTDCNFITGTVSLPPEVTNKNEQVSVILEGANRVTYLNDRNSFTLY